MLARMKYLERESFRLEAFQGPLDFLLHLVQKKELDLSEIPLLEITEQFKEKLTNDPDLDTGAEFIGMTALLLLLKSKRLLPTLTPEEEPIDLEEDPQFAIIHHLLDYCRYKNAAKELTKIEQVQSHYFERGISSTPEEKKPLGIEHLTLEDLAAAFQKVLNKSGEEKQAIQGETWRVSDKITFIRQGLKADVPLAFKTLFTPRKSRTELIVTFLAVLELMKLHELQVVKNQEEEIFIMARTKGDQ